jgi:hypothetical protein
MASTGTLDRYQPLINSSDRIARRPIRPWRAALARNLVEAISKPRLELDKIPSALNQLALLEAYQGNNNSALLACEAQIRFWQRISRQPGHAHHLSAVVLPWINIVRLERWTSKLDSSMALYSELAPARRYAPASLQRRYGIALTLDEIGQLEHGAGTASLLDVVYWREYAHLLLHAGAGEKLQQHLQAGLRQEQEFLRVALLETLLAHQATLGNNESALSLVRRMTASEKKWPHWLHFKTLEMYLVHRVGSREFPSLVDTVVSAALSGEHIERDEGGLALLVDIARLFERLGLRQQELALLRFAHEIAQEVDDEVLLFEVMSRLAVLQPDFGCDLRERFGASSYALVRKKIGLGPQPADPGPDVAQALQALAELDFDSCVLFLERGPCAATTPAARGLAIASGADTMR